MFFAKTTFKALVNMECIWSQESTPLTVLTKYGPYFIELDTIVVHSNRQVNNMCHVSTNMGHVLVTLNIIESYCDPNHVYLMESASQVMLREYMTCRSNRSKSHNILDLYDHMSSQRRLFPRNMDHVARPIRLATTGPS